MSHKRTKYLIRKHHFTIIELIIVMIIMTMMLVIALPAFTHLNKDYKQQQAIQEVGGQISIAKSYAMANHCYMAVVFPQKHELDKLPGSSDDKDASALSSYYNTSCRIALVIKEDNGNFRFVMWMPDSNWLILPENTIIGESNSDFKPMNKKLKGVRMGDLVKIYKNSPSDSDMNLKMDLERYVVVTPEGQLVIDGNTDSGLIKIRITDGAYNRQTGKITLFERSKGKQIYQTIEIDPLTCRIEYSSNE